MIIKCLKSCVRAGLTMLKPGSLHEVPHLVGVDLVKSGFAEEATVEEFIRTNYGPKQEPIKSSAEPVKETRILTSKEKRRTRQNK